MIRAENLNKWYENVQALKDVSFELSSSEILAVVGPSGCGKTTLLRVVAGLERIEEGEIFVEGDSVSTPTRMTPPHKRRLSMIFQDLALWPHMTVEENILFVCRKNGFPGFRLKDRIQRLLLEVNLGGHGRLYPHSLSGGEKQRLAIARAIASEPDYLLMDEPFSSLDPILKEDLQSLVLRLKNQHKMGILYVSHNTDEVIALADRIVFLNKGRIIQSGCVDEIRFNPQSDIVRRFFKAG